MLSNQEPARPYHNNTLEDEAPSIDATKLNPQHLTGVKLYSVFVAVSIAGFLVSLDIAVLATVRFFSL